MLFQNQNSAQKPKMDIIETLAGTVAAISPAQICQAFFLLSTCLVLSLYVLPEDARRTLLDYGARRPKADLTKADLTKDAAAKPPADSKPAGEPPAGGLKSFLTNLTSYGQVPHSWFLHFYVVSVAWSAFWAWQYARGGGVMGTLAAMQDRAGEPSVELGRVFVAWCLMALQGSRRLYESLYVSKPGSSPMWFVHWALGLVYYTTMGISVWIEGSSKCNISCDLYTTNKTRRHSRVLGFAPANQLHHIESPVSAGAVLCRLVETERMPQAAGWPQKVHPPDPGLVQVHRLSALHL